MKRYRGTRARAQRRETIWTAAQLNQDSVDSAAVSILQLVDRQDWADDDSFARGATLERIRGSISVNFGGPVVTAAGALWMAIWCTNDDETAPDASALTDYVQEDCLWSKVVNATSLQFTSVGLMAPTSFYFDVDVKAKRKLTSNTIILMTYRATGASSDENFVMSALLRGLIKKV